MKKVLVITFMLLLTSMPLSSAIGEAVMAPTPEGNSFDYYFHDAYWQLREYEELGYKKDWCLTIVPNQERDWGLWSEDEEQAWQHLVAKFSSDYRWKNERIMKKQFVCHVQRNGFKKVWNIEPWRTSMNVIDCN